MLQEYSGDVAMIRKAVGQALGIVGQENVAMVRKATGMMALDLLQQ